MRQLDRLLRQAGAMAAQASPRLVLGLIEYVEGSGWQLEAHLWSRASGRGPDIVTTTHATAEEALAFARAEYRQGPDTAVILDDLTE